MPNQYGQMQIAEGPLRSELFTSIMRRGRAPVTFRIGEFFQGDIAVVGNVVELLREDGSGQSWMYNVVTRGGIIFPPTTLIGHYQSSRHIGTMTQTQKTYLPDATDTAVKVANGPGLEDLFGSLLEGFDKKVYFHLAEPGDPLVYEAAIHGIRIIENDMNWKVYATVQELQNRGTEDKPQKAILTYSTHSRTGNISLLGARE